MARLKPTLASEIIALAEDPVELENEHGSEAIDAWNVLVKKFESAGVVESHLLQDQLYHAAARVQYEGMNPKEVPPGDLLYMLRGVTNQEGQRNEEKSRARIRGPQQSIRAYCIRCQGDDTAGVRNCPSVTCPLWSFRFGHNPFFGRIPNAEAASEPETDEELNTVQAPVVQEI